MKKIEKKHIWLMSFFLKSEGEEALFYEVFANRVKLNAYLEENFKYNYAGATHISVDDRTDFASFPYAEDKKDSRNLRSGIVTINKLQLIS